MCISAPVEFASLVNLRVWWLCIFRSCAHLHAGLHAGKFAILASCTFAEFKQICKTCRSCKCAHSPTGSWPTMLLDLKIDEPYERIDYLPEQGIRLRLAMVTSKKACMATWSFAGEGIWTNVVLGQRRLWPRLCKLAIFGSSRNAQVCKMLQICKSACWHSGNL